MSSTDTSSYIIVNVYHSNRGVVDEKKTAEVLLRWKNQKQRIVLADLKKQRLVFRADSAV